jgi:hypothetical protein
VGSAGILTLQRATGARWQVCTALQSVTICYRCRVPMCQNSHEITLLGAVHGSRTIHCGVSSTLCCTLYSSHVKSHTEGHEVDGVLVQRQATQAQARGRSKTCGCDMCTYSMLHRHKCHMQSVTLMNNQQVIYLPPWCLR